MTIERDSFNDSQILTGEEKRTAKALEATQLLS